MHISAATHGFTPLLHTRARLLTHAHAHTHTEPLREFKRRPFRNVAIVPDVQPANAHSRVRGIAREFEPV
jgi:hypothetical protein